MLSNWFLIWYMVSCQRGAGSNTWWGLVQFQFGADTKGVINLSLGQVVTFSFEHLEHLAFGPMKPYSKQHGDSLLTFNWGVRADQGCKPSSGRWWHVATACSMSVWGSLLCLYWGRSCQAEWSADTCTSIDSWFLVAYKVSFNVYVAFTFIVKPCSKSVWGCCATEFGQLARLKIQSTFHAVHCSVGFLLTVS